MAAASAVHETPCWAGLRKGHNRVSVMAAQTRLLRIGAFLVDALILSVLLILPTSAVSYAVAWIGGSVKAIQIAWLVALAILFIGLLVRDGYRGRSVGKNLLGLRLVTKSGVDCGYIRS